MRAVGRRSTATDRAQATWRTNASVGAAMIRSACSGQVGIGHQPCGEHGRRAPCRRAETAPRRDGGASDDAERGFAAGGPAVCTTSRQLEPADYRGTVVKAGLGAVLERCDPGREAAGRLAPPEGAAAAAGGGRRPVRSAGTAGHEGGRHVRRAGGAGIASKRRAALGTGGTVAKTGRAWRPRAGTVGERRARHERRWRMGSSGVGVRRAAAALGREKRRGRESKRKSRKAVVVPDGR